MKGLNKPWKIVGAVIGFAFLAYLVMDFNSRVAHYQQLKGEEEKIRGDVEVLEATKTYLENKIEEAESDQPVEEWAYEDGKMVRSGDVPVVLLGSEEITPTPMPFVIETPEPENNWIVWFNLFFDQNLP